MQTDHGLIEQLADPASDAVIEGAVLISVVAFDWNCRQHIVPRYTAGAIEKLSAPPGKEMSAPEAENPRPRRRLAESHVTS
jgi:uncharacterized protein